MRRIQLMSVIVSSMFLVVFGLCGCGNSSTKPDNAVAVGTDAGPVGIWVFDQDKMDQEVKNIMLTAREKVRELALPESEVKLTALSKSLATNIIGLNSFMIELNRDGSGAVYPCMSRLNGKRAQASPLGVLIWSQEGDKIKVVTYDQGLANGQAQVVPYTLEDGYLTCEIAARSGAVKPDETNLQVLFGLKKLWMQKISSSSPEARKPKVLVEKQVKMDTPSGFEDSGLNYAAGGQSAKREYINKSDKNERITLYFQMAYNLTEGDVGYDNMRAVELMAQSIKKRWTQRYPQARLAMTMARLGGENAGCLEGTLTEKDSFTKGPLYVRNYVLVDDCIGCLEVIISSKSLDRIKKLDKYVQGIKLNLDKNQQVTRQQIQPVIDAAEKRVKATQQTDAGQ